MESELKILLEHGYISRKQYRSLRGFSFASPSDLKDYLLKETILDLPDMREAEALLVPGETGTSDPPPDSENVYMQKIQSTAMRVASSDTTVLLLGESGVGKSRLARLIHRESPRRRNELVTVACGSIPDTLLESELFGVEKGAYTGATTSREGRFVRANQGTIFLDEIGELAPPLQVKLLRVLQDRRVEPLGSAQEVEVDVRLIAATNRNLEADVREGRFREDLFYRLNVVPLTLPPLRERREDIMPLAMYFLGRFSEKAGIQYRIADDETPGLAEILRVYNWPGNIRELENCLERLTVLAPDDIIRARDLPARILRAAGQPAIVERSVQITGGPGGQANYDPDNFPTMRDIEQRHIIEALTLTRGNIVRAAALLEIHRNTLARKVDEYGIDARYFKAARRA